MGTSLAASLQSTCSIETNVYTVFMTFKCSFHCVCHKLSLLKMRTSEKAVFYFDGNHLTCHGESPGEGIPLSAVASDPEGHLPAEILRALKYMA